MNYYESQIILHKNYPQSIISTLRLNSCPTTKITNLLNDSAINLALLKYFIRYKEQVQEKELHSLNKQLLNVQNVKSNSSTLPFDHLIK